MVSRTSAAISATIMVLMALGAGQALASPDAAGATRFVRDLYARYSSERFCAMCVAGAERIFDPSLVALLRENKRLTPDGEMGAIDADPICRCQDPEGLRAKVTSVTMDGPTSATAVVLIRFGGAAAADVKRVSLSLVVVAGRWRIHDVGGDLDSFRKMLIASNREQGAAARTHTVGSH